MLWTLASVCFSFLALHMKVIAGSREAVHLRNIPATRARRHVPRLFAEWEILRTGRCMRNATDACRCFFFLLFTMTVVKVQRGCSPWNSIPAAKTDGPKGESMLSWFSSGIGANRSASHFFGKTVLPSYRFTRQVKP